MQRLSLLVIFLIIYSQILLAVDTKVIVKRISRSGETILLNTGTYAGLKELDKAKLVYQEGMESGEVAEVGTIELIKAYPTYSYWTIVEHNDNQTIKEGSEYVLFPYDDLLKGKRPYRFLKKKVIISRGDSRDRYRDRMQTDNADAPTYKKHGNDYYITHLDRESFDPDAAVATVVGSYKISGRGKFSLDEYEDEFELKDSSDQDLSIDTNKWEAENDTVISSSYITSTANRFAEIDERDLETIERLFRKDRLLMESQNSSSHFSARSTDIHADYLKMNKISKKFDPMWSGTMQAKGIRNYVLKSGFKEERRRQKYARTHRSGHELFIRYAFDAGNNFDSADGPSLQGLSHSLGFGFGFHLSRIAPELERLVMSATFRAADDYYYMGNTYFKSEEKTMSFILDYYFKGSPDLIGAYSLFAGAGLKLGRADMISGDFGESFRFDVRSYKTVRLGLRYRFDGGDEINKLTKIGYGFSVLANYEMVTLSAADFAQLPEGMYARTTVNDYRVVMGFDFFL